jgi:hypothetical protein
MEKDDQGVLGQLVKQLEKYVDAWNKEHPKLLPWKCELRDGNFSVAREWMQNNPVRHIQATLSFEFSDVDEFVVRHFGKHSGEIQPHRTERFRIVAKSGGAFLCREENPGQELRIEDAPGQILRPFLKEWQ